MRHTVEHPAIGIVTVEIYGDDRLHAYPEHNHEDTQRWPFGMSQKLPDKAQARRELDGWLDTRQDWRDKIEGWRT